MVRGNQMKKDTILVCYRYSIMAVYFLKSSPKAPSWRMSYFLSSGGEKHPNKEFFLTKSHKKAKIFRIRKMDHVTTARELGILLRQRRKWAGLTIEELAATLPCSPRLLGELERGKRGASIQLVLRLMELLGLNLTIAGREEESSMVLTAEEKK